MLSCRNSSSVTISLPGEAVRALRRGPAPRCGWALCGVWSYGSVELRDGVCECPVKSSLERLAERGCRSEVSEAITQRSSSLSGTCRQHTVFYTPLQATGDSELDVLWLKSAEPDPPPMYPLGLKTQSGVSWRRSSSDRPAGILSLP